MAQSTIYRTPEGEREIKRLYEKALQRLDLDYEDRLVATRFGPAHVLTAGPASGPPVFILPGGNALNPVTLAWYLPLTEKYRVYAPDIIGQPGHSAQLRLSPHDDSYGRWVVDLLDALGLQQVSFIGPSYGAGIILRTAAYAPERIAKAVLHVPAGIVKSPLLPLLRELVWPMLRYRWSPSRERLQRAVRPLTGPARLEAVTLQTIGAVFRHVKLETRLPRPAAREELWDFHAPTLVLAAEYDLLFPAEAVLAQARLVIPNLVVAECLPGGYHFPSKQEQAYIQERIHRFLAETRCPIYRPLEPVS